MGGAALPSATPGGGTAPAPGASPTTNDMRNQVAAAMQAQMLAQQNQGAVAATQANPTGINPMAAAQMGFDPTVSGNPAAAQAAQAAGSSYWG